MVEYLGDVVDFCVVEFGEVVVEIEIVVVYLLVGFLWVVLVDLFVGVVV